MGAGVVPMAAIHSDVAPAVGDSGVPSASSALEPMSRRPRRHPLRIGDARGLDFLEGRGHTRLEGHHVASGTGVLSMEFGLPIDSLTLVFVLPVGP